MQQKALEQLGVIAGAAEAKRQDLTDTAEISCCEESGVESLMRNSPSLNSNLVWVTS